MPGIKTINTEILARLTELERLLVPLRAEQQTLTNLLAIPSTPRQGATSGRVRQKTSRPASAASGRTRGRPATAGGRAQQALEGISAQPGITAAELSAATGITPNYLYRLLPPLQREGVVAKEDRGYHLVGENQTGSASSAPVADA